MRKNIQQKVASHFVENSFQAKQPLIHSKALQYIIRNYDRKLRDKEIKTDSDAQMDFHPGFPQK